MKKEIRKMYLLALSKVAFAIGIGALLIIVMTSRDEMETWVMILCSVLWGIVILIYLTAGISTIKNGAKQAKDYMANSAYNEKQLNEEYKSARTFGKMHVGNIHVFVNASDEFYILPITDIENVHIERFGYNPGNSHSGYYYLYLKVRDQKREIKIYYLLKESAQEAMDYLRKPTS